jgi:putative hydrolase of the HAD superfamily
MIQAVLFDIGGVLSIGDPLEAFVSAWEDRLGYPQGEFDTLLRQAWKGGSFGEITEPEAYQRLRSQLDVATPIFDELVADFWAGYLGHGNTELLEYARGLRGRYRTGIISNSFVGAREREQERYGITDLVDAVVYSHEVGVGKPDPRIYRLACQRLGVTPQETIFLDDAPECVAGAADVGLLAIQFHDNAQAIADIVARLRSTEARRNARLRS